MTVLLAIVLAVLGVDEPAFKAEVFACEAAGGHALKDHMCTQTLAACYDAEGWATACPNSFRCSPCVVSCL